MTERHAVLDEVLCAVEFRFSSALLRMQVGYDLAQLRLRGEEPDVKRLQVAFT